MKKSPTKFKRTAFEKNKTTIAILLAEFNLAHLRNLYKTFHGDLLMALVLGEIAQHNVSTFFKSGEFVAKPAHAEKQNNYRLCNAYSISEATGIPRETVWRKVLQLIKSGYVVRAKNHQLYISPAIEQYFNSLNEQTCKDFLALSNKISELFDN